MSEEKTLGFLDLVDSIIFEGYKSYQGQSAHTLEDLKKINILIGKNNSGKSSILDVIETIVNLSEPRMNKASIKGAHCSALWEKTNSLELQKSRKGIGDYLSQWGGSLDNPHSDITYSEFKSFSLSFNLRETKKGVLFQSDTHYLLPMNGRNSI